MMRRALSCALSVRRGVPLVRPAGALRVVDRRPAGLARGPLAACGATRGLSSKSQKGGGSAQKKDKAGGKSAASAGNTAEEDVLFDVATYRSEMDGHCEFLRASFAQIRAGRASPETLESLDVDAYGAKQPLKGVAHVSVRGPQTLVVAVHDQDLVAGVRNAIVACGLDLQPIVDGKVLTVPFPKPSKEMREQLVKLAASRAEEARSTVRRTRRKGADLLKKLQDSKVVSDDDIRRQQDELQKVTDAAIKTIDGLLATKQADINKV